jgi:NTP pyrophosphatase (non-canonical NTP hydrolase)
MFKEINDCIKRTSEWIAVVRDKHGFYTPKKITGDPDPSFKPTDGDLMLGKLMLVVTEISEAAEAVRSGDMANFEEELADAYIRMCDIVKATGIDINAAIEAKMLKNEQRPVKHGRLTNL